MTDIEKKNIDKTRKKAVNVISITGSTFVQMIGLQKRLSKSIDTHQKKIKELVSSIRIVSPFMFNIWTIFRSCIFVVVFFIPIGAGVLLPVLYTKLVYNFDESVYDANLFGYFSGVLHHVYAWDPTSWNIAFVIYQRHSLVCLFIRSFVPFVRFDSSALNHINVIGPSFNWEFPILTLLAI